MRNVYYRDKGYNKSKLYEIKNIIYYEKYCITLLSLLVLVIELCAQNIYTVPVLEETLSQQKIPTNPYYKYGISQTIYLNTDINISGTITRISYKIDPINYSFNRNVTIFLAETSKSSFHLS